MLAAEAARGIFRPHKAPNAADAGCIGKFGNTAGAEKHRDADPPVFANGLIEHGPFARTHPAP